MFHRWMDMKMDSMFAPTFSMELKPINPLTLPKLGPSLSNQDISIRAGSFL